MPLTILHEGEYKPEPHSIWLRIQKPDQPSRYIQLSDDLDRAMASACELAEWSFSPSTTYVRKHDHRGRVLWEVQFTIT